MPLLYILRQDQERPYCLRVALLALKPLKDLITSEPPELCQRFGVKRLCLFGSVQNEQPLVLWHPLPVSISIILLSLISFIIGAPFIASSFIS